MNKEIKEIDECNNEIDLCNERTKLVLRILEINKQLPNDLEGGTDQRLFYKDCKCIAKGTMNAEINMKFQKSTTEYYNNALRNKIFKDLNGAIENSDLRQDADAKLFYEQLLEGEKSKDLTTSFHAAISAYYFMEMVLKRRGNETK